MLSLRFFLFIPFKCVFFFARIFYSSHTHYFGCILICLLTRVELILLLSSKLNHFNFNLNLLKGTISFGRNPASSDKLWRSLIFVIC